MNRIKYIFVFMLVNMLNAVSTYTPKPIVKSRFSDLILALKSVVQQLCFVYGIGMMLISLYKLRSHQECPEANPIGRVLSTVAAGAALVGVSFLSVPPLLIY